MEVMNEYVTLRGEYVEGKGGDGFSRKETS